MIELVTAYEKNGKVYSLFQRNEALEDGVVRFKTRAESRQVEKENTESIQKAIDNGQAYRHRVGYVVWKKKLDKKY